MNKRIVIGLLSLFLINAGERERAENNIGDLSGDHTKSQGPTEEERKRQEEEQKQRDELAKQNQQNKGNQNRGGGGNRPTGGGDRTNSGPIKPSDTTASNKDKGDGETIEPNEFNIVEFNTPPKPMPTRGGFKKFLDNMTGNYSHRLEVLDIVASFKGSRRESKFGASKTELERLKKDLLTGNKAEKKQAQKEIDALYKECQKNKFFEKEIKEVNKEYTQTLTRVKNILNEFVDVLNRNPLANPDFATINFQPKPDGTMVLQPLPGMGRMPEPIPLSKEQSAVIKDIFGNPPVELGVKELAEFFKGLKSIKEIVQEKNASEAKELEDLKAKQQELEQRKRQLDFNVTVQDTALTTPMKTDDSAITQQDIISTIQFKDQIVDLPGGGKGVREPFATLRNMVKNASSGSQLKIEIKDNQIMLKGTGDSGFTYITQPSDIEAIKNLLAGRNAPTDGKGSVVLDAGKLKDFFNPKGKVSWGDMMKKQEAPIVVS